jgi:hypothetical protein
MLPSDKVTWFVLELLDKLFPNIFRKEKFPWYNRESNPGPHDQ